MVVAIPWEFLYKGWIVSDFGVSRTAITAINNGVNFKQDNLDYPLRKSRVKPVSTRVLIDS